MGYNIRCLNEYRPSSNGFAKLIVRGFCEIKILTTQIPYLMKKTWAECDGKVAALINEEIVTIEDYLKNLPLLNGVDNRFLPTEPKAVETKVEVKTEEGSKVYFDKSGNRFFVFYFSNGKKLRKYYSISKHGKYAAGKAKKFADFKKTTRGN